MKRYVMTAKRRAALRKAQLASARKRRKGKPQSRKRKAAKTIAKHTAYATAAGLGILAASTNGVGRQYMLYYAASPFIKTAQYASRGLRKKR